MPTHEGGSPAAEPLWGGLHPPVRSRRPGFLLDVHIGPTSWCVSRVSHTTPLCPPRRYPQGSAMQLLSLLLLSWSTMAAASYPGYLPAELNNTAMCDLLGFNQSSTNLAAYMRRLDLPTPSFNNNATTTGPVFWPLYSTHDLAKGGDATVTTLAIFVHGLSATANIYFCTGAAASKGRNALVIAPWMGDEVRAYVEASLPRGSCDCMCARCLPVHIRASERGHASSQARTTACVHAACLCTFVRANADTRLARHARLHACTLPACAQSRERTQPRV